MKYLKLLLLTVVLSLVTTGSVSAQSVLPLSENERLIQLHSQKMEEKNSAIQLTSQELKDLEKKKEDLSKKLDAEKKTIEELKTKIAEKKRVAAIRAEEQIRLASYQTVKENQNYKSPTGRYAGSAGNTYTAGQCTWHVKNMKPELPNMLGNADTWFSNARAQGWPTGYEARAGAAAQSKGSMHVSYVIETYGDGTMLISEMNYNWTPYAQRTKVVNQSNYIYIY